MNLISSIINAIVNVHPWHSMTVHFPIGLTGAAALFILLALWQRSEALEKAAFFVITLAAVSTLVAGLTGMRDNIVRFDGAAPLIPAKIALGIMLFVITSVTAISRWRQKQILWTPATMVLYVAAFLISFALASVLGFMGGVILYGV